MRQGISTLHSGSVEYEALPVRRAIATVVTVINDVVVPDDINPSRRHINATVVKDSIKEMKKKGFVGARIKAVKAEVFRVKPK